MRPAVPILIAAALAVAGPLHGAVGQYYGADRDCFGGRTSACLQRFADARADGVLVDVRSDAGARVAFSTNDAGLETRFTVIAGDGRFDGLVPDGGFAMHPDGASLTLDLPGCAVDVVWRRTGNPRGSVSVATSGTVSSAFASGRVCGSPLGTADASLGTRAVVR